MNAIEKTKKYLLDLYENSEYLNSKIKEKMYRYEHTLRVAKWGEKIAQEAKFDQDALVVACLLHDISYIEEMDTDEKRLNHGRRSADIAKEFVEDLGFDEDTTKDILYGIAIHVDDKSDFEWRDSAFAQSVSDADNLDRFDAYRIYETLEYHQYSSMSLDEKEKFCAERIANMKRNLTVEFSTPFATNIFKSEARFMLEFYTKLHNQCLNSHSV